MYKLSMRHTAGLPFARVLYQNNIPCVWMGDSDGTVSFTYDPKYNDTIMRLLDRYNGAWREREGIQ